MEISDAQKEREAIAALRDAESRVNHSELIISLLVQAITHFKKHSSNRMKLYLMYNLAEEYASSKDYDKALNYYNHIVQAYRTEQWWPILEAILPSALKCAYLSANLQDWIRFSLEILNPNIQLSSQIKNQTQTNLENLIIKNLAPQVEPTVSSNDDKWKALLNKQPIVIDADTFKGLLECKVYFTHDAVSVDCDITLQVALKNGFPLPIEFDQLLVYFNLKEYDDLANVTDVEKLKFSPNEQRILTFNFTPRGDHVQRTLEIEKTYSQDQSSLFNNAYKTLLSPLARAHYLLKLENITLEDSPIQLEPDFLMRIMEINEELIEENKPFPLELAIEMRQEIDNHMKQLSIALNKMDLNKAKEILARLQYFNNINDKLIELETQHDII
ncbi:unnamed protein product [Adineta steineri]|uniref:Uncharacterized protein n=1 Tax=Adineta steineri TaxID=433720 RepID=A0A814DFN0_9BILA|nr:unnamed protein product [Adineta steineri]